MGQMELEEPRTAPPLRPVRRGDPRSSTAARGSAAPTSPPAAGRRPITQPPGAHDVPWGGSGGCALPSNIRPLGTAGQRRAAGPQVRAGARNPRGVWASLSGAGATTHTAPRGRGKKRHRLGAVFPFCASPENRRAAPHAALPPKKPQPPRGGALGAARGGTPRNDGRRENPARRTSAARPMSAAGGVG